MAPMFPAASTVNWTLIVDGAQFSSVGVQLVGRETVYLATGPAVPDANTDDYMMLYPDGSRELVIDLETTEKLYIKSLRPVAVAVRGYKKARVV